MALLLEIQCKSPVRDSSQMLIQTRRFPLMVSHADHQLEGASKSANLISNVFHNLRLPQPRFLITIDSPTDVDRMIVKKQRTRSLRFKLETRTTVSATGSANASSCLSCSAWTTWDIWRSFWTGLCWSEFWHRWGLKRMATCVFVPLCRWVKLN